MLKSVYFGLSNMVNCVHVDFLKKACINTQVTVTQCMLINCWCLLLLLPAFYLYLSLTFHRWKKESGKTVTHNCSGKPILQFVAICRKDNKEWAIPGVSTGVLSTWFWLPSVRFRAALWWLNLISPWSIKSIRFCSCHFIYFRHFIIILPWWMVAYIVIQFPLF